jgi:proton-coupled amino acid transporter
VPIKPLTRLEAITALVKGNLGPGSLNLPHAFGLTGWGLGLVLFSFVFFQGIYSMWLLIYCKNILQDEHQHPRTFMQVARDTLGGFGGRVIELLLFVVQGGVCCVFISLLNTNLQAQLPMLNSLLTLAIIAVFLLLIVLLRFLKDLVWLCATANVFMLLAIFTASVAGVNQLIHDPPEPSLAVAHPTPFAIITFTTDLFFAFEGMGLVLPVENEYSIGGSGVGGSGRFSSILFASMSLLALLFVTVGTTAAAGFPQVHSGSVTAFLEKSFPHTRWYSIVNLLVMAAVALTFPLQLTPAMQVVEKWFGSTHDEYEAAVSTDEHNVQHEQGIHPEACVEEAFEDESEETLVQTYHACRSSRYTWIWQRWIMVLLCSLIVFIFENNLALLMSLFGAVGQTGLAAAPCAMHLRLQWIGKAPKRPWQSVLDVSIIVYCTIIMVSGCILATRQLIEHE